MRGFVVYKLFATDLVASNRRHLERLDWELQRLRHE